MNVQAKLKSRESALIVSDKVCDFSGISVINSDRLGGRLLNHLYLSAASLQRNF
jgi:hypothetical protein